MTEVLNTDREIHSEPHDDHWGSFNNSINVTNGGAITICVAGLCITKPLKDWHALAARDLPNPEPR